MSFLNSPKIDNAAVLGLAGTPGSLAYKVDEIEHHFHGPARWLGATAAAGVGPGLITSLLPFKTIASGTAQTYGTAMVVFDGTEDFDLPYTCFKFDPHMVLIVSTGASNMTWKFRVASSAWNGSSHTYANMAAAVAAKQYTTLEVRIDDRNAVDKPLAFMSSRVRVGSIIWCQVMNNSGTGDDASRTIGYTVGIHGYPGN
jgi:hypothetical protein